MPDDRRVLDGIARLIIDGTNVLHAIRRSPEPLPPAALIGRLRAMVPPGVAITLVLDGSPEHGLVARHVAAGVEIRYAGRFTADEVIAHLVDEKYRADADRTLVITDDIELSNVVKRSGGRIVRNGWLIRRLERQRLSAPAPGRPGLAPPNGASIGQGNAPGSQSGSGGDAEGAGAPRWSPGRGATKKRGNGHRKPATER
jgi:hypothetical protein